MWAALNTREDVHTLLTVRKARLSDVQAIFRLINYYVQEQVVLPRTPSELYEHIWEFTVAEQDGVFVGCGGLKFYSADLAEIRSRMTSRNFSRTVVTL